MERAAAAAFHRFAEPLTQRFGRPLRVNKGQASVAKARVGDHGQLCITS